MNSSSSKPWGGKLFKVSALINVLFKIKEFVNGKLSNKNNNSSLSAFSQKSGKVLIVLFCSLSSELIMVISSSSIIELEFVNSLLFISFLTSLLSLVWLSSISIVDDSFNNSLRFWSYSS